MQSLLLYLRRSVRDEIGAALEALPNLGTLSDQDLRDLIRTLIDEEHRLSYERRLLHGKIDILRAELVARLQKQVGTAGETPLSEIDVDKLSEILSAKAPPPGEEDPASSGDRSDA